MEKQPEENAKKVITDAVLVEKRCNKTDDGVDSDILSHVNLFVSQIKNNIPLQAIIDASANDPANACELIKVAMQAVEEQLRKAKVLKAIAEMEVSRCSGGALNTAMEPGHTGLLA